MEKEEKQERNCKVGGFMRALAHTHTHPCTECSHTFEETNHIQSTYTGRFPAFDEFSSESECTMHIVRCRNRLMRTRSSFFAGSFNATPAPLTREIDAVALLLLGKALLA